MRVTALRTVVGFALWCALAVSGPARAQTAPEPLILAVHPYLPPQEITARFKPLADYLARQLDRPVSVRVGRDYEEHIAAIGKNRVDIAFMGPAQYVLLVDRHGPKPLLARMEVDRQPLLHGTIVVRQDSPLRRVADLKGKRFAYTDPDSTMGRLVPQYVLLKAGVPERALGRYQFLGAHKNVALAVLTGDFEAGAVKEEVFQEYAPRGLRALAKLPPVADHLFVVRADFPPKDIEALRQALWRLKDTPQGRTLMEGVHKGMTALVPAADKDYDTLRTILRAVSTAGR